MAIDGMVGEMTAEEALLAVLFVTANTQALAANTQTIVTAIFFIVDANAEDSRPRFCDVTTCPLAAGLPLDGSVRAVSLGISGRLATPAWWIPPRGDASGGVLRGSSTISYTGTPRHHKIKK
jgi:hypothetical protein